MRTFIVNDEEEKRVEEWLKTHDGVCRHAGGKSTVTAERRLSHLFTPTSQGVVINVKCACGSEFRPTDFSTR